MTGSLLSEKKLKIQFNPAELIVLFYVILVLFLPNFILNISRIYHIDAGGYVSADAWNRANPWLSYSFSAVELIAVLYALFKKCSKDQVRIKFILLLVVIKDLFRLLFAETSLFSYGSFGDYSIFLSLLSGYGCYLLIDNKVFHVDLEDAMDMIVILNFFTQILFVLTGRQMLNGGRYAALGSDVGSVGNICFLYFVYFIFARKSSKRMYISLPCCFLSMILSGSRSNILYAIIFVVVFFFKIRKGAFLNKKKGRFLSVFFIIAAIALVVYVNLSSFSSSQFGAVFSRIESTIRSFLGDRSYISSDSSFEGRLLSFSVGLKTISQNWLGLSGSTIDLQIQTIRNGYFTFPHSALLTYYLLWGVAALICYFKMIRLMIMGIKLKNTAWIVLFCLAITFITYGGPIVSSKTYFWYFILVGYCKRSILNSGSTNNSIAVCETDKSGVLA